MANGKIYSEDEKAWLLNHQNLMASELAIEFEGEFGYYRDPTALIRKRQQFALDVRARGFVGSRPAAAQDATPNTDPDSAEEQLDTQVLAHVQTSKRQSLANLCNLFDRGPATIEASVERLRAKGYRLAVHHEEAFLEEPQRAGRVDIPLSHLQEGGWYTYGVVSDTHFGNRHAREDILKNAYDLFAAEGVQTVFHCGNWIDGFIQRINGMDLTLPPRISSQVSYFVENYPKRDGITTYYIDGDDHEGWFASTGIAPGRYAALEAEKSGRTDLRYLGYMEADVPFKVDEDSSECLIRLTHYKGGSSYADSYQVQKCIEALSGGEKPSACFFGHYHKNGVFIYRNVNCVLVPCMEDQTTWARGKRLRFELGFYIVRMLIDRDGSIKRFLPEQFKYFDKQYYENKYGPDDFAPLENDFQVVA